MNALIGLGLGIIVFALIVATGLVVMSNFASSVAECPTGYGYQTNGTQTYTTGLCCNSTNDTCTIALGTDSGVGASSGTDSLNTMTGYMQDNLITWIPAVIALGVGLLFIGALMGKRQANSY